jgi:hypothetical protein
MKGKSLMMKLIKDTLAGVTSMMNTRISHAKPYKDLELYLRLTNRLEKIG